MTSKRRKITKMNVRIKIIMAAVNIACLTITLLRPDATTPLGVLTTACSTVTWLFGSQLEQKIPRLVNYVCIIIASLLALFCIVLNSIGEIKQLWYAPSIYYYECNANVAFIGGSQYLYNGMAIGAFIAIVGITLTEIICTFIFEEKEEK